MAKSIDLSSEPWVTNDLVLVLADGRAYRLVRVDEDRCQRCDHPASDDEYEVSGLCQRCLWGQSPVGGSADQRPDEGEGG